MKQGHVVILIFAAFLVCFAAVIYSTDIELFTTQTNNENIADEVIEGGDNGGYGGRTFTVIIENFCDDEATCYLTVDNLRYVEPFTVSSKATIALDIIEDELFVQKGSYDISLFAEVNYLEEGTALDVTESAEFLIHQVDGELVVENTYAQ